VRVSFFLKVEAIEAGYPETPLGIHGTCPAFPR
jgi:hypothetical protein